MNQTFLLRTLYTIIRRVEVRDQDSRETLQHFLNGAAFTSWGMKISHLFHTGEHPDIAILTHDANAGLVDVQYATLAKPFQYIVVGAMIGLSHVSFEPSHCLSRYVKTKQLVHGGSDTTLR